MNTPDSSALAQAYHHATYQIDAEVPIVLHLDTPNPALANISASDTPLGGVFLTACNPHSRQLRPAANDRRMRALAREVARLNFITLPGRARDPQKQWPDEPSVWISSLPLVAGRGLARRFGQNAFLWCDAQCFVHLVWTT